MSIEEEIKLQYSKIFKSTIDNWMPFKQAADFYFNKAAKLKKSDIVSIENHKLWFRNVQKRLFLGIAAELLIKAIYLKNGFNINRPKKKVKNIGFPEKLGNLNEAELNPSDTYTLDQLFTKLENVISLQSNSDKIKDGLKICKVFRNKEGHVAVHWHTFDNRNYNSIEYSIIQLYSIGFSEIIEFKISMEKNQKGKFEIKNAPQQHLPASRDKSFV